MRARTTKQSDKKTPPAAVIYITRDIERALGIVPNERYTIIANATAYAREIKALYPEFVLLIESDPELLDTYDLLTLPEVEEFIASKMTKNKVGLVVFKNTTRIEKRCAEKKWQLLNPSADLSEKIENKITQVAWLGKLDRYLPPHRIIRVADIVWGAANPDKSPFIIQWAHSHTGDGTALVRNEKELALIQSKFPGREARVTEYIRGSMFTANISVCPDPKKAAEENIRIGNISYQITGILPFTDNPFSTIGNDWSVTHSILAPEQIEQFNEIARAVGTKMLDSGWRGLFGIDCIYDEGRNTVYLIEINARQPASTTFESQLQNAFRKMVPGSTVAESHIAALQEENIGPLIEINDGAQIIQRLTDSANIIMENPGKISTTIALLRAKNFTVIEYSNTKTNADILRIQSSRGIMEGHMKFNARGKEIVDILLS